MSSYVDEDTARAVQSGRETAGAMLRAAQKDLRKVFIVFVIGLVGTVYALRLWVWDFLKANAESRMPANVQVNTDVIVQTPFDVILLQVKIGLVVGGILAVPVLLYYSRDALRERGFTSAIPITWQRLLLFAGVSILLFAGGVYYAFAVFFPFMFTFLAGNAVNAAIKPSYGIVEFTQFILLLMFSFGFAAQLPLVLSGLSYTEIVPYETLRDKWRYAVVGIFLFGAVFSPPDPFTQIMWAMPLCALYAFSLSLAKVVANVRRAGAADRAAARSFRRYGYALVATVVLVFAGTVAFGRFGGYAWLNATLLPVVADAVVGPLNDALASLPAWLRPAESVSTVPFRPPGSVLGEVLLGLQAAVAVAVAFVMGYTVKVLREPIHPPTTALDDGTGSPEQIDLGALDAAGVRAAPPEVFLERSEDEILEHARAAMDADRPEKAQAIFDRYDEVHEDDAATDEAGSDETADTEDGDGGNGGDSAPAAGTADAATAATATDEAGGDPVQSTATGVLDAFTDDGTTEDDIGGYYYDLAFILDSLRSKAFRIVAVFMTVLAGTFAWLYSGGLGDVRNDFLSRIPPEVLAEIGTDLSDLGLVIALHPVEALIFEVKVSTLLGLVAVFPMLTYYAWPSMQERGLVDEAGNRNALVVWGIALLVGFFGGIVLGYSYVAPNIISYLVADAIPEMIISYRLRNFFWLILFTTVGIGLLTDVVVTMVLFDRAGLVRYEQFRGNWREVTFGIFVFAAFFSPPGILTMLLLAIPLAITYAIGLGALSVVTVPRRLLRALGRSA